MDSNPPEVPKTHYIPPIITINKDGNIEVAENHFAFTQLPIFEKLLRDFFRGSNIKEIYPQSNLESFFRTVSLLSGEIVEDNPNFIEDRWSDLVARVFKHYDISLMINKLGKRDRFLFSGMLSSLNNSLGDRGETTSEEKRLFDEIFLEYLQGKRGVLEGIDDKDFYDDLKNNRGQIFELLKQGKTDSRFIIVLNYALLAYKDWVEQRFNLPKAQIEKGSLTNRIKKAQEERDQRIQEAAQSLFESFRSQGLSLEQMEEVILKSARELGISKEELEEEIKKIKEIYDRLEAPSQ